MPSDLKRCAWKAGWVYLPLGAADWVPTQPLHQAYNRPCATWETAGPWAVTPPRSSILDLQWSMRRRLERAAGRRELRPRTQTVWRQEGWVCFSWGGGIADNVGGGVGELALQSAKPPNEKGRGSRRDPGKHQGDRGEPQKEIHWHCRTAREHALQNGEEV